MPELTVTVREVRELVARLVWALALPYGWDRSATHMITLASAPHPPVLERLVEAVKRHEPCDPLAVEVEQTGRTDWRVVGGRQTSAYVGPVAADLICVEVARASAATIEIVDAADPTLLTGLEPYVADRLAQSERTASRSATGVKVVWGASSFIARPRTPGERRPMSFAVEEAVWDELIRLSLDVLLEVDFRPYPEDVEQRMAAPVREQDLE